MKDVRAYALSQLLKMETEGRYLALTLGGVPEEQRGFLTALLYGIAEHKITLDYYMGILAKRSDFTPEVKNILRIGLYQLLYMENIPPHAVVDTAVSLAKKKSEAGFINAILRKAVREPEALVLPPREKNPLRHLSIRYSIPLPTLRLLVAELGEEGAEAFLQASEKNAPLTVRVNTLKIGREQLAQDLHEEAVFSVPTTYAPHGEVILGSSVVTKIPGYDYGWFFVQDEAGQIAVEALAPKKGSFLIDVCAAPGGKSFSAAMVMKNQGHILSLELHESKVGLILKGAERLGIRILSAEAHDSRIPKEEYIGKADYVICDVPCSGMGVLRKKPEIRYKNPEDFGSLPALQGQLLESSGRYLKKGGRLLYSTCTIFRRENQQVVEDFLCQHPEFHLVPFQVGGLSAESGMVTLLPHIHETDGFFVALLEKS